ncbi:MAG TPA: hypothetical protein VJX16_18555 [Terriglobales bacterium]|nr:hypothetical protein [Terriglobales bacterium]
MNTSIVYFLLILSLGAASQAQSKPVPPARRELQRYEAMHPDEPPQVQPAHIDQPQLEREAEELFRLAQSVRPDVERLGQGMLPKDVVEKLKRIEKLSKQLRSQISP